LTNQATIPNSSAVLELKNVPAGLIMYAVQQWTPCMKYAKNKAAGHNTNTFIRGISVWLILKSETTSGNIKKYRAQLPELAAKCKMSVRTMDRYIAWLKCERLVHTEGKNLFVHNYEALKKYGINTKDRMPTIYYDTENKTTLAEIIVAIAITKMKERWMQMYWNKINQNQDEFKVLSDLLIFFKADAGRLHDRNYFRECHLELMLRFYKEEKPGQRVYDFLHTQVEANPDINCMAATYAKKMGYSAAMSFCHLKFKMIRNGLIKAEKDHIESECRSRKDEKMFHHRYVRQTKSTIWFRCDQITVQNEAIFGKKIAA